MKLLFNYGLLFALACCAALESCSNSGPRSGTADRSDSVVPPSGNTALPATESNKQRKTTAIRKFTETDARTYKVEVIISDISEPKSFRKLLEKLPDGYKVNSESLSYPGAHFKPGELKYIWVDNYEPSFSVTYVLKIPKGKKLIRDYEGYFAYIENNEKVSIPVQSE